MPPKPWLNKIMFATQPHIFRFLPRPRLSFFLNEGTIDFNLFPIFCAVYCSENVARKPLGPPALPLILPRAFGNPAAVIDALTISRAEIQAVCTLMFHIPLSCDDEDNWWVVPSMPD